ncbi:hypothetical protein FHY19_003875 [Xanthomonas arboricola]|nr:hypothetical protein [Xanthomonas sp. 4461]
MLRAGNHSELIVVCKAMRQLFSYGVSLGDGASERSAPGWEETAKHSLRIPAPQWAYTSACDRAGTLAKRPARQGCDSPGVGIRGKACCTSCSASLPVRAAFNRCDGRARLRPPAALRGKSVCQLHDFFVSTTRELACLFTNASRRIAVLVVMRGVAIMRLCATRGRGATHARTDQASCKEKAPA